MKDMTNKQMVQSAYRIKIFTFTYRLACFHLITKTCAGSRVVVGILFFFDTVDWDVSGLGVVVVLSQYSPIPAVLAGSLCIDKQHQ